MGALGRDAEDVAAGQLVLDDERPLASGGVDAVEIGGRQQLLVAEVGARVASDGPLAIRREVEIPHRLVGELDEAGCRDVEGLAEGEIAVLVRADHLERLHPVVVGVPHVHVSHLAGRAAGGRVRGGHLLLDAEEDALVVLAPRQPGTVADDPALREAVRLRGIERDRRGSRRAVLQHCRHVGEGEQHVVPLPHLVDVAASKDRQRVALVVPGEPAVALRGVVERRGSPAPRVVDEQAVDVFHGGVHRVGEQLAGPVERNVGHPAEQLVAPGTEVQQDGVLTARGRRRGGAGGLAGPGGRRLRGRPATTAAPATVGRRLTPAPPEVQVCRGGREGERSDVLPRADGAGGEVSELDAAGRRLRGRARAGRRARLRRAGLRVGRRGPGPARATATPAALGGRGVHVVDHPLRIGREGGAGRVRDRRVLVRLEIEEMEDRLRVGRQRVRKLQRVGDPLPVGGNLLAGDGPPLGVVVDGHRLLRRRLRLQQAVSAERDRQGEREGGDTIELGLGPVYRRVHLESLVHG